MAVANAYQKSIAFPKIFNSNGKYNLYSGYNALKSDLKLLLMTEKGELYGDPNYGVAMKKIIYSQAHEDIALELVKDDIFEAIKSYFPQITIDRNDIEVVRHNIVNEGTNGNGICKVDVAINLRANMNVPNDSLAISLMLDEE